ncbi:MAG TPA: 5-formyltetrahydrofolate cyclo-ligase [Chryseolinea sp.]
MTKEELRKVYIQKRHSLSDTQYLELNSALCRVFFKSVDLSEVNILHCFLPIQKNKEPDTLMILDQIKERYPEVRLSLPRVNETTHLLESIFLETSTVLKNNSWGIPEPQEGKITDPLTIDMVLVPMLIFDRRGHRVGYGKGYYDKFLTTTRADCKRVGICLFDPVDPIDDIMGFDEPLNECITPSGPYKF